MNFNNVETIPSEIEEPELLTDQLKHILNEVSLQIQQFLRVGESDVVTLNRAVKLCYRATSLISTLRDIAPLYRGPGAALLTYTSLVLGQASNLLLRYQNCYRAI